MIIELVKKIAHRLVPVALDAAESEAWWLLEAATKQSKAQLLGHKGVLLSDDVLALLEEWVDQRVLQKKPLQYILGSVPFAGHEFIVRPPVLIPRPETEEWVLWLIDLYKKAHAQPLRILDLCTGSGCIGLTLAAAFPDALVDCVDIAFEALDLVRDNSKQLGVYNIRVVQSDCFDSLEGQQYDLIVANPPYLTPKEYNDLSSDVKAWEDKRALVDYDAGLGVYKKIAQLAPLFLNPRVKEGQLPCLIVELGLEIVSVRNLFLPHKYTKVEIYADLQQKQRWLAAWI